MRNLEVGDVSPDAFSELQSALAGGMRKNDRELLSPVTGGEIDKSTIREEY
jgi:hypothetical protein